MNCIEAVIIIIGLLDNCPISHDMGYYAWVLLVREAWFS